MVNYLLIVCSILMATGGQLCLKQAMLNIGYVELKLELLPEVITKVISSPFVYLGAGLYGLAGILWLVVLSRFELSRVQPLTAVVYIFILFFSWFLFKENISWIRISGVMAIALGLFLVSRS